VSEWKFENSANDSSGNGNNGTNAGSPSYVAGRFGQGIYLNRLDFIQKVNATNLPVLGRGFMVLQPVALPHEARRTVWPTSPALEIQPAAALPERLAV
jgi:hypothetical protein